MELEPSHTERPKNLEDQQRIAQEAASWFARLQSPDLTAAERADFHAWLGSDVARQKAFRDLQSFWQHPLFADTLARIPLSSITLKPPVKSRHRRQVGLALAASLLLGVFVFQNFQHCLTADFCTATGETRYINLPDGSQITLASDSAVNIGSQNETRRVQLVQGEAYFNVHRDPDRPFVVDSHYSQIRVLGTQFIVRENPKSDTITVISGIVSASQPHATPVLLKVSDQITVTADSATPMARVSTTQAGAWTKGYLIFENATLETVAAELSRYRGGVIVIKNKRLKNLKVSGRFSINDTNQALDALEQTLPLRIYRITSWLTGIA
jgi:transmembrane sensor